MQKTCFILERITNIPVGLLRFPVEPGSMIMTMKTPMNVVTRQLISRHLTKSSRCTHGPAPDDWRKSDQKIYPNRKEVTPMNVFLSSHVL